MLTRLLHHIRKNVIAYLALFVALGAGGGYAVAASNNKTITVCADKKTGVLHLKTRGRCKSSQTRVSWNQQGPARTARCSGTAGLAGGAGVQGCRERRGAQGPAGVSVWADVADNGTVIAGQGIAVQRMQAGTYQVTITDPTCALEANAPVVSVSDAAPGSGPGRRIPGGVVRSQRGQPAIHGVHRGCFGGAARDVHGDRPHVRRPGRMPVGR